MLRRFVDTTKTLADPNRTRILKILEIGELCVCQIAAVLQLAQSSVSQQLALLRKAGFIRDRRSGRWVYYSLVEGTEDPFVSPILKMVRENLNEDGVVLEDRRRCDLVRSIAPEEVCQNPQAMLDRLYAETEEASSA